MDGFKAYRYYLAVKLHFTDPNFNVFETRGRVKASLQSFNKRNDRLLFEKLARQYPQDREYILYIAANFMYGNTHVVYNETEGQKNYNRFIRNRQSMTRLFANDLDTIVSSGAYYNFSGPQIPEVLQLYISGKISIETMVILNDLDNYLPELEKSSAALLFSDTLMQIKKAKGFVKYDAYKVMKPYQEFKEEMKGYVNG